MTVTWEAYREIKQSLCRESFEDFIGYVRPGYVFNWHHLVLIDHLQRLADGEFSRLVVMMPPRHGKSELVSRLFPAWMLARNKEEQIIASSYSSDLASAMNRDCQRIMTSEAYREIFPESSIGEGKEVGTVRNNKRFDVLGGRGYYVSAGVGGGITGVGCTIGIIDDPVKNAEEADSETYRNKAWEWYATTFKTRFEPGCKEVICQTRWHEDDLTGRILQRDSSVNTKVVRFPALAKEDEAHRSMGDPLWEGKYNREALLEQQAEVGTRAWNALYQQDPTPEDGGIIKKTWFGYYDDRKVDFGGLPPNFYFDTAYTDDEKNDPTAGMAYIKKGADYYILDCEAKHMEFLEALKFINDFHAKNGYTNRSMIRVEPKASGKSLVQVIKKTSDTNIKEAPIPKGDKVSRANSVAPTIEAGRVFLPLGRIWVQDFLDEVGAFPNGAHDDRVDCLTGMIISEQSRGGLIASG